VVVESVVAETVIPELALSESDAVIVPEEVSSTVSPTVEVQTEEVTSTTESSVSHEPVDAEPVVPTEEPAHSEVETTTGKSEEVLAEMPALEVPASEVVVPESSVAETVVQIEQDGVPAPEDFSVEVKADASGPETIEPETSVRTESPVTTEASVMVAENSSEETVQDHSDEVPVESEPAVTEPTVAELPEPADPVLEESAVHSDTVAMNEAASNTADSKASEANEEEKSLEDKLLQSGEYDMLDVHSEDVTAGTVEPAIDGGATCIPLPRNLASGTWQIIHPSGEFFKITVDRGRSSNVNRGDDDTLETSFCITTSPDGVRWCFIRSFVDSPAPVRRVTTEFFSPGQQ
jgi:hypothetical protein